LGAVTRKISSELKEKIRIAKLKLNEAIYAANQDIVRKRRKILSDLESQLPPDPEPECPADDEEKSEAADDPSNTAEDKKLPYDPWPPGDVQYAKH
jgi:hypothetical protein